MDEKTIRLIRLLLARLERISADSYWAHRASGIRGALLRLLDEAEGHRSVSSVELRRLLQAGFEVLEKAAMECSGP